MIVVTDDVYCRGMVARNLQIGNTEAGNTAQYMPVKTDSQSGMKYAVVHTANFGEVICGMGTIARTAKADKVLCLGEDGWESML